MKRLWTSSLAAKFFFSYLALVALLFAGFYYASNTILKNFYLEWLSGRMGQEAVLLGRMLPFDAEGEAFDRLCQELSHDSDTRLTVIAADGKVLCDSAESSATLENHAGRPEVIEAMNAGSGSAIRFSTTVGYDMLYRAFLQGGPNPQRIVRVATPLHQVERALRSFRQTLISGLLLATAAGLLLAWLFSRFLGRRFHRLVQFSGEIARGNYPPDFFPRGHDEIALLERHLHEMALKIRDNLSQVLREKDKVDSILRCMIEGVLVLDPKGNVLVINDQARAMFNVPPGRRLDAGNFAPPGSAQDLG
jgi:two-component system phosphate regulon sensor histidine kinase PhoR